MMISLIPHPHQGTFAMALVLTVAAATTLSAQDPIVDQSDRTRDTQKQHGQDMQVQRAHEQLNAAAFGELQRKAREWKEGNRRPTGDERPNPDSSSSLSLGQSNLLIAACSKGLLAGAPTTDSEGLQSPNRGQETSGTGSERQPEADKPEGSRADTKRAHRTVGMILVATTHSATNSGVGEDQPRDSRAHDASGQSDALETGGRLRPGVYAVKVTGLTGNSISLTDQSGRVVLSTTIQSNGHAGDARRGSGESSDKGPGESDRSRASLDRRSSGPRRTDDSGQSWETIFGAVAKEVMITMGWANK